MKRLLFLSICCLAATNGLFSQVTMDQLIGVNARAKDPWGRLRRFALVREYHDWGVDIGRLPNNTGQGCPPPNRPRMPADPADRLEPE